MISMHKSGDIIYKAKDKPKGLFIIHEFMLMHGTEIQSMVSMFNFGNQRMEG